MQFCKETALELPLRLTFNSGKHYDNHFQSRRLGDCRGPATNKASNYGQEEIISDGGF
jgi:hypothetical protein